MDHPAFSLPTNSPPPQASLPYNLPYDNALPLSNICLITLPWTVPQHKPVASSPFWAMPHHKPVASSPPLQQCPITNTQWKTIILHMLVVYFFLLMTVLDMFFSKQSGPIGFEDLILYGDILRIFHIVILKDSCKKFDTIANVSIFCGNFCTV